MALRRSDRHADAAGGVQTASSSARSRADIKPCCATSQTAAAHYCVTSLERRSMVKARTRTAPQTPDRNRNAECQLKGAKLSAYYDGGTE